MTNITLGNFSNTCWPCLEGFHYLKEFLSNSKICSMIDILVDNIFVKFGWCLFRQVVGIPMGTNCAPLLANLFLYSSESEFLDSLVRNGHRRLALSFNFCYRHIYMT